MIKENRILDKLTHHKSDTLMLQFLIVFRLSTIINEQHENMIDSHLEINHESPLPTAVPTSYDETENKFVRIFGISYRAFIQIMIYGSFGFIAIASIILIIYACQKGIEPEVDPFLEDQKDDDPLIEGPL